MMANRVHRQYQCTFEACEDKLELEVIGLDLLHGAVHLVTSDAGMAMA